MKNLVGKPRPDLIDRCQPRSGSVDPPVFGLSSIEICTQTSQAILKDGMLYDQIGRQSADPCRVPSFPSGHSSSSFAGLFYHSLYLAGKLHVVDQCGEVWRTLIVLIPTLAASCIAISRVMDARHHPFDVLFGGAMGILVAWGLYRQYFPLVSNSWLKDEHIPSEREVKR
jgi:diacylglycerol diphosphate phosphatase/phosphatidate phosphatase